MRPASSRASAREGHQPAEQQLSAQFYTRFSLFNPDPLFTRLVSVMRWVWTTQFFAGSLLLMLTVAAAGADERI